MMQTLLINEVKVKTSEDIDEGFNTGSMDATTGVLSYLSSQGILSEGNCKKLLSQHNLSGLTVSVMAVQLGMVSEQDMAQALSTCLHLPLAEGMDCPDGNLLAGRVLDRFLRKFQVIALNEDEEKICLATANPLDLFPAQAIEFSCGKKTELAVGSAEFINRTMQSQLSGMEEDGDQNDIVSSPNELDIQKLENLANEAPVIKFVNQFIQRALAAGASDIHIEPDQNWLNIRNRIDGVLHHADRVENSWKAAVVSRLKLMAQLDIAERRLSQDGRINLTMRGRDLDIRVATTPTMHGESVVLRLLDKTRLTLDFDKLGYTTSHLKQLRNLLAKPNGILLVTGPTGSGKTTTLYAALSELNDGTKKILTVEDPVEYILPGINQIQVKPKIDLTFASALRSFLRHDPDIIMVGEIRDLETAQVAIQAALTGHLVLATLHTNDAVSAVTRFVDMGVDPYLISATLNGVVAQRLIRNLCEHCKLEMDQESLPSTLKLALANVDNPIFHATGCAQCLNTGYKGRSAVTEILSVTDEMRTLIAQNSDKQTLLAKAKTDKMRPLFESGLDRVISGQSDMNEVNRILRLN